MKKFGEYKIEEIKEIMFLTYLSIELNSYQWIKIR